MKKKKCINDKRRNQTLSRNTKLTFIEIKVKKKEKNLKKEKGKKRNEKSRVDIAH